MLLGNQICPRSSLALKPTGREQPASIQLPSALQLNRTEDRVPVPRNVLRCYLIYVYRCSPRFKFLSNLMFNYEYQIRQTGKTPPSFLSTAEITGSTSQCPGRSSGVCLRHMVSDLKQKRKLNHASQHLLAILSPKTTHHMQYTFLHCCWIIEQSFPATCHQLCLQADQTEHCNVLPAFLEDTAVFEQSFDSQTAPARIKADMQYPFLLQSKRKLQFRLNELPGDHGI